MATPEPLALDDPRAPHGPVARRGLDAYPLLFMRLSGLLLIVLVLLHLFTMNIPDIGVQRINFAFVAGRWSTPLWRIWDLAMLWLAELHGTNGLRTVINDYARRGVTRTILMTLLFVSALLVLGIGTFVICTFDPNLAAN